MMEWAKRYPGRTAWVAAMALLLLFSFQGPNPWAQSEETGQAEQPEATLPVESQQPAVSEEEPAEPEGEEDESLPKRYRGSKVGVFSNVHLAVDEVAREAVCVFSECTIEGDVRGDLVVVMGKLELSGDVGHDVVTVFSDVTIAEGVEIGHDFVNVGGPVDDRGASIHNQVVNLPFLGWLPSFGSPFGVIGSLFGWGTLLGLILQFITILILAAFVPERIRMISEEAPVRLGLAYLVGLGVYLALLVIEPLLFFTVVGWPIFKVVFFVLKTLGLAGLLHFIGKRIGGGLSREMSLLGAILIVFIPLAAIRVIPYFLGLGGIIFAFSIRFILWLLLEVPAVGLLFVTRFGSPRQVTAEAPQPPVPPADVSPPPPPPPPPPSEPAPPSP
jgi:hypothetical protein